MSWPGTDWEYRVQNVLDAADKLYNAIEAQRRSNTSETEEDLWSAILTYEEAREILHN